MTGLKNKYWDRCDHKHSGFSLHISPRHIVSSDRISPASPRVAESGGIPPLRRLGEERERSECSKCYSLNRQTLQGLNHIKIQGIQRSGFLSSPYVQWCRKTAHHLHPINFVSWCVGTKLISDQHIVQYLVRRQKEITASLAAVKLKHAHCCI